jgi:hypothetical protein
MLPGVKFKGIYTRNPFQVCYQVFMQPLTVITGILLGSSAAIASGLAVVLFLFWLLADDYPRLNAEMPALLSSSAIFVGLTALCAISFLGLVKDRGWRWLAQFAMWLGLFGVGWFFWP